MAKTPPSRNSVRINLSSRAGEKIESVFFNWAVNTGKIIIVLTELIALSALGYRFFVDRQIIDLHDQINRDQLLLKGQADKEREYRNIQTRLAQVELITNDTKSKINVMNNILAAMNNGNFSSTDLAVNQNIITLEGSAISVFALNGFLSTIKSYDNIKSISLDDLESSDQGIKFRINIELKQNESLNN